MSYRKQSFVNRVTVLTAEHLDHIEDGIYKNSLEIDKLKNSDVTITDEQIESVVENYLAEHPVNSEGNLLVVTFTEENGTLTPSHTYDQIKAWTDNGGYAVLTDGNTWYPLFASKSIIRFERVVIANSGSMLIQYLITPLGKMDKIESHYDHTTGGGGLDATIDGETLVFAESSTATIENETLIL